MIRIGIAGSGFMATVHALRYAEIDDVEVAAVASPSRPTDFAAEYAPAAEVYADPVEMYDTEDLDAVDVCTPTDTHRELTVPALERGLHVLCEKPVARTLSDAEAMADAAASADATVTAGHTLRFFPEYETARERVRAGDVGEPGNVRTLRQSPFAEKADWFQDDARSGGVLLDLAIHDLDFLRWTFGEVERVFARRQRFDDEEFGLATLRFSDDTVAHVDARWPNRPDLPFRTAFEIAGDDGLLEFDSELVDPIEVRSAAAMEPARDPIDEPLEKDPYRRELEAFVDCVRNGTDPPVPIDEGIATLCVGLAALESAERGRPIAPREVQS